LQLRPNVGVRTAVGSAMMQRHAIAWVAVLVAGVVGGLVVVHVTEEEFWANQLVAALGGLTFVAVAVAVLRGVTLVEIFCVLVIWVSTFSGLLRDVNVGPISANGAWTLVAIAGGGALWLMSPRQRGLSTLSPLLYFAIQGAVYLIVFPRSVPGIQSVLAVFAFIVCIVIVVSSGDHLRSLVRRISTTFGQVSWIAIGMYGATIAVWGLGNDGLFGPRGFALLALIPLAWNFACWRYGDRSAALRGLGLLGAIVLSLSRLATGIGLLLWPLSRTSSRASLKKWGRVVVLVLASLAVFFVAFETITPLRDRFLQGDVESVGRVSINVSGRDAVWSAVWHSALKSPWIGQGAGSSESALVVYGFKVSQPHNEYLRILHDFGLIGLVLWVWGYFGLLGRTFLEWRRADRTENGEAYVHLAAWLGLVALALGMITDNPLRYVQVLLPLGLTVGCSLGLATTSRETGKDEIWAAGSLMDDTAVQAVPSSISLTRRGR
jgi:O-antigen ligase